MDYFKLPTGYDCFSRSGSQIQAYRNNNRDRATFELINFKWEMVQTATSNTGFNVNTCLSTTDYFIPEDMLGHIFLAATIAASLLCVGLFKVFSR